MSTNTRVSLGVAFLSKAVSKSSSAKCIIHAEYIVPSNQYLLTKISYVHNLNMTLDVHSSETYCENIVEILRKLSKNVEAKVEEGFAFDSSAMSLIEEDDETWDDFKLSGTDVDPLLDTEPETKEELLEVVMEAYSVRTARKPKLRRQASVAPRKISPIIASRIRNDLNMKSRMR